MSEYLGRPFPATCVSSGCSEGHRWQCGGTVICLRPEHGLDHGCECECHSPDSTPQRRAEQLLTGQEP